MNTRRIIGFVLSVCMMAALTACGSTTATTTTAATTQAPATTVAVETTKAAETTAPETTAAPEPSYAIETLTVGTTMVIETATREEYNYDMLASGVSEIPVVSQNASGEYEPLMCTFQTEDAKTWIFTVREGMTWSDGVPVTAEDILYTLQFQQENGSAVFEDQTDADGKVTAAKYEGAEISADGRSISLTLAKANVRELSNMTSFRVMPKHIYEGKDSVTEDEARVGCGPYRFESFNREAGTITFVADENYPDAVNVGTIVYQLFSNDDAMILGMVNGDIDMIWNYSMGIAGTFQEVLAAEAGVTLTSLAAANAPAVLAFNNANGLFANEDLRQAVSYALDYEQFLTYFGSAYASVPARGFVPQTTVGFAKTDSLSTDYEKADAYMKAAGYTEKNGDGFYVNADGVEAGFTLTVNSSKDTHVGYAELVKTQLEAFGIRVTLDSIDKDSYNAKTSNKFSENNITMEAAIYGYTAAGMGMGNGLGSIYVDGNHAVQGGCQVYDEEFAAILSEMGGASNIEEYYAAAEKLQAFYAEHMPLIALYWDNMILAYNSNLENVTIDANFGLNNANNWLTVTEK